MTYWRDSSDRLTYDPYQLDASAYPSVCREISEAMGLTPVGELLIGWEQMFWDFRRGDQRIGLDWDIWSGLMVVAKSEEAEPMVREIVAWLRSRECTPE